MRLFQSLSVGIVLTVALCAPAKALQDFPLVDPLMTAYSDVPQLVIPYVYDVDSDVKSQNLKLVYDIASKFGYPEIIQGMLLQESNGGTVRSLVGSPKAKPSRRSYGLMQVQIIAAKSIFSRYPELFVQYFPNRTVRSLRDREVIDLLMTNHEANVTIAVYHYDLYLKLLNGNHTQTIAAYNVGIGGVKKLKNPSRFKYVVEVKQKIETVVKAFNEKYNLKTATRGGNSVVLLDNK